LETSTTPHPHIENFSHAYKYLDLEPYKGVDFSIELPTLHGGSLLWAIIGNMRGKYNCYTKKVTNPNVCKHWTDPFKYYAWSLVRFFFNKSKTRNSLGPNFCTSRNLELVRYLCGTYYGPKFFFNFKEKNLSMTQIYLRFLPLWASKDRIIMKMAIHNIHLV
jgi:hypothetical protein